jgi:hypothetical protein
MAARGIRAHLGPAIGPVLGPVVLLVAVLTLAGCFGGGHSQGGGGSTGHSGGPPPSGTATTYPVAPSASPSALPVVGARTNGQWTFALTAVHRAGPGQVLVEGILTSRQHTFLQGFEEPGFALRKGADGKLDNTYEFSAVSLTVPGDSTVYQPMRDAAGRCACTQGVLSIEAEQPYAVYTLVTAPPAASKVSVLVQGFAAFDNVAVTA